MFSKQSVIGVLVGMVLTGLPIYVFMEARIEKRVTYEVTVKGLQKDIEALANQQDKHEESVRGKFWVMEADLKRLDKEIAVSHAGE